MKFLLTLFLAILFCSAYCQPTLTNINAPKMGQQVTAITGDNMPAADPGDSGPDAIWDYGNMVMDPNTVATQYEYMDPASHSMAALFPSANFAYGPTIMDPTNDVITFFESANDEVLFLGFASAALTSVYTDPQLNIRFPFTYEDSFSDSFEASFDLAGTMTYVTGDEVLTGDAYGHIITPEGSFDNVLRIKRETTRIDSSEFAPDSYIKSITNLVTYNWIKNSIPNSLATIVISSGQSETHLPGLDPIISTFPETSSFTWYTVPSQILALEIESFFGKALANGNLLEWSTFTDEEDLKFEIFRSTAVHADWERIQELESDGDFSNSYLDQEIINGETYYYKLIAKGANQVILESDIIAITNDHNDQGNIFPNPVSEFLNIHFSKSYSIGQKYEILNNQNQVVANGHIPNNEIGNPTLDVSRLSNGMYFLKIGSSSNTKIQKFIKI